MSDGSLPQPGIDRYPFAVFQVANVAPDHPALARRRLAAVEPLPPVDPVEYGP
jgi:hypothetical protein